MRVTRCPRCRAEDIAADADPGRILNNGAEARIFVCRGCCRPTELEYRIACETTGGSYRPLPIRAALAGLHEFSVARLTECEVPNLLIEDHERAARSAPSVRHSRTSTGASPSGRWATGTRRLDR